MTAMDILEALGQTDEKLLRGCDGVIGASKVGDADIAATDKEDKPDAQELPDNPNRKRQQKSGSGSKMKYRRAAAGFAAAAAVLLLVYVLNGTFISRRYDLGSYGSMSDSSTAESADMTADTAEEESALEEAEAVEMEEESTADEFVTVTEETETGVRTETAALETLQLGEVYIPGFASSAMSEEEYAGWLAIATLVQEEIDAALSQEAFETLPVYHFVRTQEPERIGDYPVITAEEAEGLLWQGYYIASTGFSEDDIDSAEAASVELVYLIGVETQIYMPYYQFTVVADGDMVFLCCVPAVSSEYLEGNLNWESVE